MITLVRHATTDWSGIRYCGRTDVGLNREGRRQLEPLARFVATLVAPGASVVASPARRCRETATAIASALGCRASVDERLREIDFGDAEGLTFAQLQRCRPDVAAAALRGAGVDWPGGERWPDFTQRVESLWRELEGSATDVVIVGHGGPLRLMLGVALPDAGAAGPHLGPAHVVALRAAGGWHVRSRWAPEAAVPT